MTEDVLWSAQHAERNREIARSVQQQQRDDHIRIREAAAAAHQAKVDAFWDGHRDLWIKKINEAARSGRSMGG